MFLASYCIIKDEDVKISCSYLQLFIFAVHVKISSYLQHINFCLEHHNPQVKAPRKTVCSTLR